MASLIVKKTTPAVTGSSFWKRFQKLSDSRKNARSETYMQELLREKGFSKAVQIETREMNSKTISEAQEVVLLWNDGNGSGWMWDEFKILLSKSTVRVLNGRRRDFTLSFLNWPAFLVRRGLEHFWVGEFLTAVGLLAAFPFLLASDKLRGRA